MFHIINDILHQKSGKYINDPDSMGEYSLYMVQRWISMFSNQPIDFLNSTVNIMYGVLDNEESYKFLLNTLPKYKHKRISYIKAGEKVKKKKSDEVDVPRVEESLGKLNESMKMVYGEI